MAVTPLRMFSSSVVLSIPSRVFSSAALLVSPVKLPDSPLSNWISSEVTAPIDVSSGRETVPLKVGLSLYARLAASVIP